MKDLMLCAIAIFIGNIVFAILGIYLMGEGANPSFVYKIVVFSMVLVSFVMARILIKEYRRTLQ